VRSARSCRRCGRGRSTACYRWCRARSSRARPSRIDGSSATAYGSERSSTRTACTRTPQALSASPVLPYCRFAPVTVQLKLYDDGVVLIEGPRLGEERTALLVRRPDLVAAAKDLFGAALATSVPAAAAMADDPRPWLAPRQRDIIDLMAQDLHDDEVADQLGVSIRTVRGDIEVVRRLLGVRTRFAVGYRLGQLDGAVDLSESEAD
jgi:DNA-binding CsgD family transcriptional regulator